MDISFYDQRPEKRQLPLPASPNVLIQVTRWHVLVRMPELEEVLAAYLAPRNTSARASSKLPTKPYQLTAEQASHAYASVGQASRALNMAAVLQEFASESRETSAPLTDWRRALDLSL